MKDRFSVCLAGSMGEHPMDKRAFTEHFREQGVARRGSSLEILDNYH